MATTRLGLGGFTRSPYGSFAGKSQPTVTASMHYTPLSRRMHYNHDDSTGRRMHYTPNTRRLHYNSEG